MGDAARRKKLGVVRQSVDTKKLETAKSLELLRERNADRVKKAIELWNQHRPDWDDCSFDRERIEDLSLIDRGIYVVNDNGGKEHCGDNSSCEGHPDIDLIRAVPIGGKRRGGFLCYMADVVSARDVIQQLDGQPGFPNPRIERRVCVPIGPCDCQDYIVRWGDERIAKDYFPFVQPPEIEAAIGRFFGYSEQAIEKHMNIYRWLKSPEGLAFSGKHGYGGGSLFENWSAEIRAEAESLIQEYAKLRRVAVAA
jgi:hypothetical protein